MLHGCALRRVALLAALCLCALASGAQITLPIEVLGPVGTTRSVTVTSSAAATALSLRIHGLAHADMAEVRVDSGAWIPLNNTSATVAGLGGRYGGIGGTFATLDLRVPITATPAGSHAISFRFAAGDGVTIGFRVLRLDLLDAAGGSTVAANSFRNDDPATWTPPLAGADHRAAGETLWRSAPLVEGIGGPSIRARCSDCHAQDGRDLAYFNYSNHAIIERSTFHGLSDTQANQIASYIRSLPGSVHGRPWNPPYQPGPGLTSRPVSEWAAGAGIDAVAMEDADTLAYVPGATGDAREIIDEDGHIRTVPIHDIPKAFQFLDWNHWLPRVHPLDVPGYDFTASSANTEYGRLRDKLSGPDAWKFFYNDTFLAHWGFNMALHHIFGPWAEDIAELKKAVAPGATEETVTQTQATHIYSAGLWSTVKMWEIMQEFGLENRGKIVFGGNSHERLWYSNRFIFDTSPFLSGIPRTISLFGDGPAWLNFEYVNNSWYELQMQLNAGRGGRNSSGHSVIDWGYMSGHFWELGRASGEGEPVRQAVFALMSMQHHDAGHGPEYTGDNNPGGGGWDIATSPTSILDLSAAYWSRLPNGKPLIQAIMQATAEKNARFSPAQWAKANGHDGYNMPVPSYVLGSDQGEAKDRNIAEQYLRTFLRARDTHQIDEPVVNGMAAVGALIWANNDWSAHRRATAAVAAPATCTASPGVGSIQITWAAVPGATSYNLYRADSGTGRFAPIRMLMTGTTAIDRRLLPGSLWDYRVSANQDGKEGPSHSPIATAGVGRGLVGRWAFDEADGDRRIVDASGQRNHGELIGAAQRIPGRHGGAVRFTAHGQYASVIHNLQPTLRTGATVTVWVRSSAQLTGSQAMTVLGSTRYFGLVRSDGRPAVKVHGGEVKATTSVLDGQWHHLAMSHAANDDIKVWVDGALQASGRFSAQPDDYYEIRDFGHGVGLAGADTTWLGDLDDVRLYDQELSADEIRAIMDDGSMGPAAPAEGDDFRSGVPEPRMVSGSLGTAGGSGGGQGCGFGGSLALLLGALVATFGRIRREY